MRVVIGKIGEGNGRVLRGHVVEILYCIFSVVMNNE